MTPNRCHRLFLAGTRSIVIAAALAWLSFAVAPLACQAQSLPDQARSLRLVPADAAFYSANLRIKEQWDLFAGSKAYARLMQIPFIQSAKMYVEYQLQESPEPPIAMFREYMASEEGKAALALLKEMFADEAFAYGSADMASLLGYFMELNSINQSAQFESMTSGRDLDDIVGKRAMEWLNTRKDELNVPDGVFGFRVRDRARATRHLDVLHTHLKKMQGAPPELAARLKREQINGREFLILRLDGSLLPWDDLQSESDLSPEDREKLKSLISAKTLVVAIGVVDDFVVASFGDTTEHLAKLGQGSLMAEHASIARLSKHATERVTAISFASQDFLTKINSPKRSMDDAVKSISELLKTAPISEEQQATLREDMRGFADAIVKYFPQAGETSAINFLTARGYEAFAYGKGTRPGADSSRPLEILNHVGGNPLLIVATHAGDTIEDYSLAVDWVKRLAVHVEKIAEQQSPPAEWAEYLKHRERGLAILRRIDRANREQIIPALKANEQAFVVDVASKSVQWFAPLPRSPEPLAMIEIGLVSRVDDASLLRKGVSEYAAAIQDGLNFLHEISPDQFPKLQIPAPETRRSANGEIFSYSFPAEWGVDSQLALNGGLSDKVFAVSLQPAFTEQLLKPAPISIDTAIDLKRPATMATHFQFAKLLAAVRPWIDYGVGVATGRISADGGAGEADPGQQMIMMQAGLFMPQVNQLLDVFSTLRSHTSITYREDDAWVTHAEMHLKDLE